MRIARPIIAPVTNTAARLSSFAELAGVMRDASRAANEADVMMARNLRRSRPLAATRRAAGS